MVVLGAEDRPAGLDPPLRDPRKDRRGSDPGLTPFGDFRHVQFACDAAKSAYFPRYPAIPEDFRSFKYGRGQTRV
jgi:hypothetical protein